MEQNREGRWEARRRQTNSTAGRSRQADQPYPYGQDNSIGGPPRACGSEQDLRAEKGDEFLGNEGVAVHIAPTLSKRLSG